MRWHSPKEAAPLIGLSDEIVYRLCASGRLAHRRVGLSPGRGKIQISDAAIADFLRSCEVQASEVPKAKGKDKAKKTATFSGRADGKPLKYQW